MKGNVDMKPKKSLVTIKQMPTARSMALDAYFRDVNKYKMVTPQEEVELIRAYKDGDRMAGEKLVLANLRFVVSVAKQYSNNSAPLADLISAGNMGLVRAMERFDETRGFKFISYAVWWIRQSILQEMANNGRPIRLPLNVINLNNKHRRETGEDLPEIAALHVGSPNHKVGDDNMELIDLMKSSAFPSPDEFIIDKPMVHSLIEKLTPREQVVVRLRYGIDRNGEESTYEEIAAALGTDLTRERIRQIHVKAMRKLKSIARRVNPELLNDTNADR